MSIRRLSRSAFVTDDASLDFVARLWVRTAVAAWLLWLVPWAVAVCGSAP